MKQKQVVIIIFIMCFLLTIGICIQVKTIKQATIGTGSVSMQNDLRDEVIRMQEKYKRNSAQLDKKQKELDELMNGISNTDDTASQYNKKLENLNNILGYNSLKGEGIIIKMEDAEVDANVLNISDYLVHDKDLLQVVNALINAGAEAIDINGQRIVSDTEITCVGNVIKINNEKVGTPYIINAIGLPEKLYGALTMPGGYLSILKNSYGLEIKVEKSNNVKVEKYNGVYKMEHATINQ